MNIWRVYLIPHGEVQKNEFGFCYQRNIIGIGWQIDEHPGKDKDKYLNLVAAKYSKMKDSGKWDYASKTLSKTMDKGDLVWVRNHHNEPDRFCLGEITGEWEYRGGCEYCCADIVSVRPCKLYEVRHDDIGISADDFFKVMKAKQFRRGITVQRISGVQQINGKNIPQHTIEIWDKIKKAYKI